MYLIAGLGNPTPQYDHTRHNVGFDAVTYLADRYHISMNTKKFRGICGTGVIEGQKVLLLKPQTFMNLSGESVGEAAAFYKLDPETEIIIIYDDIALEPGSIRVRKRAAPAVTTALRTSSPTWEPRNFSGSASASGRSRRNTTWRPTCWGVLRRRTAGRWRKPSRTRRTP